MALLRRFATTWKMRSESPAMVGMPLPSTTVTRCLELATRASCRVAQQRVDIDGPQVELHATGFHTVEVQHLGDHPAAALGVGVDVPRELLHLLRRNGVVAHDLAITLYPCQGSSELMADHGHELALQLAEALETREVRQRRRIGFVLRGDVVEHGQDVLDSAARIAYRRGAPMDPELASIGANRLAVRLHRIDLIADWRDRVEHFLDVGFRNVISETRSDDDTAGRAKKSAEPRVRIRDSKLATDASKARGRMPDDLVQECGPLLELHFCALALGEQSKGVAMGEELARREQDSKRCAWEGDPDVHLVSSSGHDHGRSRHQH